MLKSKIFTLAVASFFIFFSARAQDPLRFADQIDEMLQKEGTPPRAPIIFVGSSSVRMWKTLSEDFPGLPVINRGFGGSQMSDLLYYLNRLVIKDRPRQVFIYEGDNDISAGKSMKEILRDFKKGIKRLHHNLPNTEIVLISPKPSIARWNLKAEYEALNARLEKMTKRKEYLIFADVWEPMLGNDGKPLPDIFIEDNLHMNAKGYEIWKGVMGRYVK